MAMETEPIINSSALTGDKKRVNISLNTTSATDGTYVVTVKILTVDNQTITRRGRLVLARGRSEV